MNPHDEILKIKNELLDEFDKRVEALKVDEQEFPKIGRRFYVITTEGKVTHERWEDDGWDRSALAIGNVFKTEEEAEFAVEKLKVEAELRKFGRRFVAQQSDCLISYEHGTGELEFRYSSFADVQGAIYFESKEKAQQAIESVGEERIKKYIFGVEG